MTIAPDPPRALRFPRSVRSIVEFVAALRTAAIGAFKNFVRRMFFPTELTGLDSESIERFAQTPFGEAYIRPQGRPVADAESLVTDMLGRGGLTLGTAALCLSILLIALGTGIYAPR